MDNLIIWVAVSIVALIVDMLTSSFLFVWFAVGGIAAIITMVLGYSITVQAIVFFLVSVIFMIIGYPIAKKTLKKTVDRTLKMEERYIGRNITVEEEILEKGNVKIDGIYWTVKNEGSPLKSGDKAEIIAIEGNKLLIKKTK